MGASHLFALEVACTEGVQAYLTGFPDVTILRSASSWALTRRSAVERRAQPPRTVAVSDSSEEALAVQRRRRGMKRSIVVLAAVALVLVGIAGSALAESPAGMRLYAFSSGALTVAKNFLQAGGPPTQIQIPVGFFVVRHPRGNVIFDTGNNDRILTDPGYWGDFVKALNPVRTPDIEDPVVVTRVEDHVAPRVPEIGRAHV